MSRTIRPYCIFILLLISVRFANGYDSLQVALAYHQASDFEKALPIFINLSKKFRHDKDVDKYALCQLKIADVIRNYGGINLAIEMLKTNEQLLEARLEKPSLLLAQNYIAKGEALYSASRLDDYKQAVLTSIFIKKSISLSEKYLAEDYMHLARYYKEMPGRHDSCYYWALRSVELAKSDRSLDVYLLPKIYNLIGYYFHPASGAYFVGKNGVLKMDSLLRHFSVSKQYYDSALAAMNFQHPTDQLTLAKIYHNLGNHYNNKIRFNTDKFLLKAIFYYRKSMSILDKFGSPPELAQERWVIATAFYRADLYDSALAELDKGILEIVPHLKQTDLNTLPEIPATLNDDWFASLIKRKGDQFYKKYKLSGKSDDLLTTYEYFLYLLKFNHYLISKSKNEQESSFRDHLYGLNSYQFLMQMAYELYRKTNNIAYIKDIYPLLVKSKYAYLNKDDLEPQVASMIANSVLEGEHLLVKKNILKRIPSLDESKLEQALPKLFKEIEAKPLTQKLPPFHKEDTLWINGIQMQLDPVNSALLDYYISDYMLHIIVISKDNFDVIRQLLPSDFRTAIWKLKKNLTRNTPKEYARASNSIYRNMLDSAFLKIPKATNKLIICPDFQIQDIPWDGLAMDTLNTKSFKSINYLMRKFAISTVLTPRHLLRKSTKVEGFYGVGVDFVSSKKFAAIPFSTSLVKVKSEEYHGRMTQALPKDSIRVGVLHIATHIVIDSLRPYNSTLYYNDEDSVTIADLSKTKIKPSLVILNGCQTGDGTYYQSEGTISFARAFYRMGAQSVLMTLWSVDDKATADILGGFYTEMDKGNPLDISLRNAKLDFIENTAVDELANPYYWAGLQVSGKTDPMQKPGLTYSWLIFSIFTSLLFFAVGFYYNKRNGPLKFN